MCLPISAVSNIGKRKCEISTGMKWIQEKYDIAENKQ